MTLREPFLWCEELLYSEPYLSEFHSHPAWQLTLAEEGVFEFECNGTTVTLSPGEWILLSPEFSHTAGSRSQTSTAVQLFFRRFPENLLPEFAGIFNFRREFFLSGKVNSNSLTELIEELRTLSEGEEILQHSLENLLPLNFIMKILKHTVSCEDFSGKSIPSRLLRALEYMEKHYSEPLGVPDFAAIAGISVSRFNELFCSNMGIPPMRYFNEIRLSHAQVELLCGASVIEAAARSGFSSSSYFCRCFKNSTGLTPGEFQMRSYISSRKL